MTTTKMYALVLNVSESRRAANVLIDHGQDFTITHSPGHLPTNDRVITVGERGAKAIIENVLGTKEKAHLASPLLGIKDLN